MTASERIREARLERDKVLVSALDQNPVETRETLAITSGRKLDGSWWARAENATHYSVGGGSTELAAITEAVQEITLF